MYSAKFLCKGEHEEVRYSCGTQVLVLFCYRLMSQLNFSDQSIIIRLKQIMKSKEIFELLLRRIESEHRYIDSRIGWLLASQLIILAAIQLAPDNRTTEFAVTYLPFLGLSLSLFTFLNVLASAVTMTPLIKKAERLLRSVVESRAKWGNYLSYDRPKWVHPLSIATTCAIPLSITIFWLCMIYQLSN